MAENATIIGLVALISATLTGLGVLLKYVKHSECMRGCCEIDTRTPTRQDSVISAPPPTPQTHHKRKRHNAESDDTEHDKHDKHDKNEKEKSEFNLDIAEIQV